MNGQLAAPAISGALLVCWAIVGYSLLSVLRSRCHLGQNLVSVDDRPVAHLHQAPGAFAVRAAVGAVGSRVAKMSLRLSGARPVERGRASSIGTSGHAWLRAAAGKKP